jgi:acetolactate synthase-1/3 small subunit
MRHTISVLVENKFGVLARLSGMISGRGFNIDSLNVAPTHDATLSRITLVLNGNDTELDLCTKQLRKLINVVEIVDFKQETPIARELVLVKVRTDAGNRQDLFGLVETFHATIVNKGADAFMVELAGDETQVNAFLSRLEPFGIIEIARTGLLALKR